MDAAGQQWGVAEVDAQHHVRGAEGHMLDFGEKVVGVAVEHHAVHRRDRHPPLGDELDITHICVCALSGISETKSQSVSWADAACVMPW